MAPTIIQQSQPAAARQGWQIAVATLVAAVAVWLLLSLSSAVPSAGTADPLAARYLTATGERFVPLYWDEISPDDQKEIVVAVERPVQPPVKPLAGPAVVSTFETNGLKVVAHGPAATNPTAAFDGDPRTAWGPVAVNDNDIYIEVDAGRDVCLASVDVAGAGGALVQRSADGKKWVTSREGAARFWRFYPRAGGPAVRANGVAEISLGNP